MRGLLRIKENRKTPSRANQMRDKKGGERVTGNKDRNREGKEKCKETKKVYRAIERIPRTTRGEGRRKGNKRHDTKKLAYQQWSKAPDGTLTRNMRSQQTRGKGE
jgi:hypothetical protein